MSRSSGEWCGRETGHAITVIKTTGKDASVGPPLTRLPFSLRLSIFMWALFIQGSPIVNRGFYILGNNSMNIISCRLLGRKEFFFSYVCVWVGGLEEVCWYEYKWAVTRHNNPINIWAISVQISGWTCALCVNALISFSKCLSIYAKTHGNSIKAIFPYPSSYFLKCLLCWPIENKQQYTASGPHPICAGQKKQQLSLLFSLPLSALFHSRGSRCCWRVRAEQ